MNMSEIGNRLQQLRTSLKLTQRKLADTSGISQGTISRIELGTYKSLDLDTAMTLAAALNVSTSEFLGERAPLDDPKIREVNQAMQGMAEYKKDVMVSAARSLGTPEQKGD